LPPYFAKSKKQLRDFIQKKLFFFFWEIGDELTTSVYFFKILLEGVEQLAGFLLI
jgi:hypothetical protein